MTGRQSFGGKRELLAHGLLWSGTSFVLSRLPLKDSLLVLNYHRIGNPDDDIFDPNVFSTSADQFNEQISYLKRHLSPVTPEEALSFIDGSMRVKDHQCRVLITFDDGYLDNYKIAYPILCSHGMQSVFFLATGLVGSCQVPWWDHIAYLVKTAQRRRFSLRYPANLAVDLDKNGRSLSLRAILKSYKRPDNADPARFIGELAEEAKGEDPPEHLRRFLNWDEAREMARNGMAIGSHTHSHQVLSQLKPEQQYEELCRSRAILKEQLGIEANLLAYPVGAKLSFTNHTRQAAQKAGFRAAFSHYGGANLLGKTDPYDVARVAIRGQSLSRFRVRVSVGRFTGRFWP
jgi:peptidoglycan/xylan/chitin deacetylase (PgdA/CDA1 family)